jgi:uncharacterized protein DUF1990
VSRADEHWAEPVAELHVAHELPPDAVNLNLEGRRVAALAGGFGKMWQKTYRIVFPAAEVSPADVIRVWREHFRYFFPKTARFYGPDEAVAPGDVVLLNLRMPGGLKMSTGVLVIYADDESFSFQTPEGHQFTGMITFSARRDGEETVVQAQALFRAQDPLSELGMMLGGHRLEDKHWIHTLESLAKYFAIDASATVDRVLVDKRRQWKHFGNVKRSAVLRPIVRRRAG